MTNLQTGKPLDPKSLRKHFALEIGIGAAEANFLVGRLVLATIQGAPPPPGTVAITDPRARTRFTILFAKARMGWRETGVDWASRQAWGSDDLSCPVPETERDQ